MQHQQRPTSPLGYDRPLSPSAVSPDVYRRSVPGISDLVRGTTRSVLPQPYLQQQQQRQQHQQHQQSQSQTQPQVRSPQSGTAPVPYDMTVGEYEEPLHQPVVTSRNQPRSMAVSVDRRLGGAQIAAAPASRQQQQQEQQQSYPPTQTQGQRAVINPTTRAAAPRTTPLQEDIKTLERRIGRVHGSLNGLSEQMHVYQQQTVQRQDRLLADVCKQANEQSTMLNILLAGVVLVFLLALITSIYTTFIPMFRGGNNSNSNSSSNSSSGNAKDGSNKNVVRDKKTSTTSAGAIAVKRKTGDIGRAEDDRDDDTMSEGIDSAAYARELQQRRRLE